MKTDLFRESDIQELKDKMEKIEKSTAQVRKGLFARNTALEKRLTEMDDRFEELLREMNRLKTQVHEDSQYPLQMVKEG